MSEAEERLRALKQKRRETLDLLLQIEHEIREIEGMPPEPISDD